MTWTIPLGPTADDWQRIEVTARMVSDVQTYSLFHGVLTSPEADTDGLKIGSCGPAAELSDGAIAVVEGEAVCTIVADTVANAAIAEYCWDCKIIALDDQVLQGRYGALCVKCDVTKI